MHHGQSRGETEHMQCMKITRKFNEIRGKFTKVRREIINFPKWGECSILEKRSSEILVDETYKSWENFPPLSNILKRGGKSQIGREMHHWLRGWTPLPGFVRIFEFEFLLLTQWLRSTLRPRRMLSRISCCPNLWRMK